MNETIYINILTLLFVLLSANNISAKMTPAN